MEICDISKKMSLRKYVKLLNRFLLVAICIFIILIFHQNQSTNSNFTPLPKTSIVIKTTTSTVHHATFTKTFTSETTIKFRQSKNRPQEDGHLFNNSILNSSSNIHIFYFTWFKTPRFDNTYSYWDVPYIPESRHQTYQMPFHRPPHDISANFYPWIGCYSSNDPEVVDIHFRHIKVANIGVVVLSIFPLRYDENSSLDLYFKTAEKYGLKIAFQIMKIKSLPRLKEQLLNILTEYQNHSALYRLKTQATKKPLPLVYAFQSYKISSPKWNELLSQDGKNSIRDTPADAIFLGMIHTYIDLKIHVVNSKFDGFYTYKEFGQPSWATIWSNWAKLVEFANDNDLLFIPSICPGYLDTRIRKWDISGTIKRRQGLYYKHAWLAVRAFGAYFVAINSYNDWNSGTQIEPARPYVSTSNFVYYNYSNPAYYLNATRNEILMFEKSLASKLKISFNKFSNNYNCFVFAYLIRRTVY